MLVVSNIDAVLRPKLVPKEAQLSSALVLLSLFGGVKLFGFLGVIYGPVVMIFLLTTVEVYMENRQYLWKTDNPELEHGTAEAQPLPKPEQ